MSSQEWGERYSTDQMAATAEFFTLIVKVVPRTHHPAQ